MLAAMRVAYERDIVHSGPTVRSIDFKGPEIHITFDNTGNGLKTKSPAGIVGGFAVAGDDRGFVWATAKISSPNTVIVTPPQGLIAVAVRYAWANNPVQANLINSEALPALPFRSESWPGPSHGVKYNYKDDRF